MVVVGFVLSSFSSDKNSQQPVWERVGVKYFYLSVTLSDIGGNGGGKEGERDSEPSGNLTHLNKIQESPSNLMPLSAWAFLVS